MSVLSTKSKALARLKKAGIPIKQVVDVGVNKKTIELIAAFPELKHWLFEIDPGYNEDIAKEYQSIDYSLFNIGLSDLHQSIYRVSFSIHKNGIRTHTRLADNPVKVDGQEIIECERIEIQRFDSLEVNIGANFILKIDVDGKDINVLRGFGKHLSAASVIIVEATANKIEALLGLARDQGFALMDIVDRIYYGNSLYQVDLIFVRRDLINPTLSPNIKDFQNELWQNDDGQSGLEIKILDDHPVIPTSVNHRKEVRVIANADWAIIVPDDVFYQDKKLPQFESLPKLIALLDGALLHDFCCSNNNLSNIWLGHKSYKVIANALRNSQADLIIDIGAYAGIFSVAAGSLLRETGTKILALEPNPSNVLITHFNLLLNEIQNASILPFAVGNSISNADFIVPDGTSISGHVMKGPARLGATMFTVPQVSIDALLCDTKEAKLIVKIDTEGHEYEVLKGMEKIFKNNQVLVLIFEYHPQAWKAVENTSMLDHLFECFEYIVVCSAWQFSNAANRIYNAADLDEWIQHSGHACCDVICLSDNPENS